MAKSTIIITYDLKYGQTEVKEELTKLGYLDTIQGQLVADPSQAATVNLPNTTLSVERENMTPQIAMDELFVVVANLNKTRSTSDQIKVERVFVCKPSGWLAKPGDPDRT